MDKDEACTIIKLANKLTQIAEEQKIQLQFELEQPQCQSPIPSPKYRPSIPLHTTNQFNNYTLSPPTLTRLPTFAPPGSLNTLDIPSSSSADPLGSTHSEKQRPNTLDDIDIEIEEPQQSQQIHFDCPHTPTISDSDYD